MRLAILWTIAAGLLLALRGVADPLPPEAEMPAVVALADDGSSVDLGECSRDGLVLVFFFPKANTSGCTAQACSLRDSYAALVAAGVRVIGVSTDSIAAQREFRAKNGFPFPLIADTDQRVAAAFGVPTPLGFAARQTFLFRNGRLIWHELVAPTTRQAAEVFAALKAL